MAALAPVPAASLPAAVARIAALMADFSLEATRPSDADIAALAVLPRGKRVYVSAVPHRPAAESVDAAIRLRAAGFEPVPRVAVRNFANAEALDDFLGRLNGEADVRRVLVIAGDREACGPFRARARRHRQRPVAPARYPHARHRRLSRRASKHQ